MRNNILEEEMDLTTKRGFIKILIGGIAVAVITTLGGCKESQDEVTSEENILVQKQDFSLRYKRRRSKPRRSRKYYVDFEYKGKTYTVDNKEIYDFISKKEENQNFQITVKIFKTVYYNTDDTGNKIDIEEYPDNYISIDFAQGLSEIFR